MRLTLNLARRGYRYQRQARSLIRLALVVLLTVMAYQGHHWSALHSEINAREQQLALLRQDPGGLPSQVQPEDLTASFLEYHRARDLLQRDNFRWTELFDRMESLLPEGIGLRSFQPDYKADSLRIEGVARDLHHLQALLDNLLGGEFSTVNLLQQSHVRVSDGRGGTRSALNFSLHIEGVFL